MARLTPAQCAQLRTLPFRVYSPSSGGGRDWAELINAGLVSVEDIGDEQETILLVDLTDAGRASLTQAGTR